MIIKSIAIIKKGPLIITDHESARYHGTRNEVIITYTIGGMKNSIPPINSYLHAMRSIITKINDGMRCMNNAIIVSINEYPFSNTSNANILINKIAIMPKIRGVQYNVLLIFVFMKILRSILYLYFLKETFI
jgi:hypothetical protein